MKINKTIKNMDSKLWNRFVFKVKSEKKDVAEVITPMIEKYLKRKIKK